MRGGRTPRRRRTVMVAARPAVIGAFVLGGLAIATAAILFFGGGRLFERTPTPAFSSEDPLRGSNTGWRVPSGAWVAGSANVRALPLSAAGVPGFPGSPKLRRATWT